MEIHTIIAAANPNLIKLISNVCGVRVHRNSLWVSVSGHVYAVDEDHMVRDEDQVREDHAVDEDHVVRGGDHCWKSLLTCSLFVGSKKKRDSLGYITYFFF